MVGKIEILKTLFTEFLNESEGKTIIHRTSKNETYLNSEVYEFQAYIAESLKNKSLNLKINPTLYSEHIRDSFKKPIDAFTAQDYCYSFFEFLNVCKREQLELFQLIDRFIELHKAELSWKDIEITSSGATRCMTNIRFALNSLRAIGLIEHNDKLNKRSFQPTLLGEMIFYNDRKTQGKSIWNIEGDIQDLDFEASLLKKPYFEFYNLLNKFISRDGNSILTKEFLDYSKQQKELDFVAKCLNNLDKFFKNAIITETGIHAKDFK
ncbi:MAG TPA: hypothetical protein PLV12_02135 [Saprospiraceae bacterium]|nr:hypothetical protein [Saprospiraceae bacterium]